MSSDSSPKHLEHDLNNIFTRVLHSIDLLKRKISGSPDLLSLLNSIEAGTYLASEMIGDNLGDKSRNKNQRRINLNLIISDIVHSFSIQQKNKIDFSLQLESSLSYILGKYSDYYRVVLNLITNAIESIEKTGSITISTLNIDDGARIKFVIADTGAGIDKEVIPLVFNENFSTKNKKTVSGLGLSIVKNILDYNRGTISLTSELGKGTEFTIVLESAPAPDNNLSGVGGTIFIAEDEEILRELLTELLQSYNYSVFTSANGYELLEMLKIKKPDLLIIDRKMPEMDGVECIQNISAANYNIPIILATGSSTESINTETIHINRVIKKPYNFEELLSLVRELIG